MPRLLLTAAVLVALAGAAEAYPQFQISMNVRCSQCHYAPAGGGPLTDYGRDESAETISRGGDGSLFHGLWEPPSWFTLAGDFRFATLVNGNGATDSPEVAYFPMQADLYTRFAYKSLSLVLFTGYRGAARSRDPQFYSRLISREHYLMWRPKGTGPYARVGRFFAPFGLRLLEHPTYVRRNVGFNTLEETYNVSGGWVENGWEIHATAFYPDFVRPVGTPAAGAAVYGEKRLGEHASIGLQGRLGFADETDRYTGGVIGKLYFEGPRLLLMGELDVTRQTFAAADAARTQLASFLGATYFLTRGYMVGVAWERYDEDVSIEDVAKDAFSIELQYFPRAHFEVLLYGRYQMIGAGSGGDPAKLVMLQLHYYL